MESFEKYFTIEHLGSKGWEVVWTCNSIVDAIERFRGYLSSDLEAYRLTSPTIKSIYTDYNA